MGFRAISARTLGVRVVAVAAALTVGVSGLTACRTNVGNAATIDGQRISESDVNDYVTASAQPIKSSDGSQSIAPKPFVITVLIRDRLYRKLLAALPGAAPTAGQLSTLRAQYLAGSSVKAKVESLGATGYTSSFDSLVIDVQAIGAVLSEAQQQGVDVAAAAAKLTFPVSVNPRYGTWDAKNLSLDAAATSGLPGFLSLQTASATTP